jgi:monofunctional glycosyltransferase
MNRRSWPVRVLRAAVTALLATAMLSVVVVFALRWLPVPTTAFMVQDTEPGPSHDWVSWSKISGHAAVAVIAAEDQNFPAHDGFDFQAIDKAMADAGRGRPQRGASTISQQVAKNLFLWPGRSWVRKGLEVWFTIWIEALWPKQRILEVYLNSVEFGRGVWGVEAASRHYFGKPAARLTRHDAALLAAVLPNPKRLRIANPSPYVRRRQDWILGQMRGLGGTSLLKALD